VTQPQARPASVDEATLRRDTGSLNHPMLTPPP
jgi:hypothetical protein